MAKRSSFLTAVLIALALLASACGGSSDGESGVPIFSGVGDDATESPTIDPSTSESPTTESTTSSTSPVDDANDNDPIDDGSTDNDVVADPNETTTGSTDGADPVAAPTGGVDTDTVANLAGQALGSCSQLDLDALATVFGEQVFVTSDVPPAALYRHCTVFSTEESDVALGYVDVAPDLDGGRYRLDFADEGSFQPLETNSGTARWTDGFFTQVEIESGGAEMVFQARIREGGTNFGSADPQVMAAAMSQMAADLVTPATAQLPPAISGCDDIAFTEISGESIGDWTTASFDGMLNCVAETSGGSRVSLTTGDKGSTDNAVLWVNTMTDDVLEASAFDFAYPIQWRSDNLDRGYASYEVTVFNDYSADITDTGSTVKATMTLGSHGQYVAWLSLVGPLGKDNELYNSDMADILEEVLAGIDSDYDIDQREEDIQASADAFFDGSEVSLDAVRFELDVCESVDIDSVTAIVDMGPASLDSEGGWWDYDDTVLNCNFYAINSFGELDISFGSNPVDVTIWNGEGDEPWASWKVEDAITLDSPYGTLRYSGADLDIAAVYFADESGTEVEVEFVNKRTNPVTLAEALDVLELVVGNMS